MLAASLISDVDLLCNCQGIIHFNAEITNCALDLSVTKKQLHDSQIARASIDQCSLGSAKRMSGKDMRVQSNTSNPFRNEPSILSGCQAAVSVLPAAKHELTRPFPASPQIPIDRLASVLGHFKPNRLPRLLLAYGGPIGRISVGRNILDL